MLPVAHDSMLFSKMGLFCFLPLSLLLGPYAECSGQAKHQRMLSRADGSWLDATASELRHEGLRAAFIKAQIPW